MQARHFRESYGALMTLTRSGTEKVWVGILIVLCLALPLVVNGYWLSFATMALVMIVGVLGLNLLTGVCGLISLGHAGFLAVGAYGAGIAAVDFGVSLPLALILGGLLAAVSSLLVGIPSLRLKGLYLAITTLAFTVISTHFILNMPEWTRGSAGMFLPAPSVFGYALDTPQKYYLFCLAVAAIFLLATLNIMRSRIGRALVAIREQDIAAEMMGVNLRRYKLLAFALSAFFTGVSGGLFAWHIRYINVDTFGLTLSIEALGMVIVGGLGSVAGAVIGAVFMTLLPEAVRLIFDLFSGQLTEIFASRALELRGLIYGAVIILVLRFQPDGLIRIWRETRRIWGNWPFRY